MRCNAAGQNDAVQAEQDRQAEHQGQNSGAVEAKRWVQPANNALHHHVLKPLLMLLLTNSMLSDRISMIEHQKGMDNLKATDQGAGLLAATGSAAAASGSGSVLALR